MRGTNFCTSSARFSPSSIRQANGPECTQIVRNTTKRQLMVQWGGSGAFIAKSSDAISWHDLVQYFTSSTLLHRVSCSNKILPNTAKHYEMHTNMSLGSNGVDRVRLLQKIPMRFHGTNLCINCTCSTHFAPSFV